jgi:transposase-like protein
MQQYSESFKRKMVQRLLLPDGPSASALAREVGIPQSSLSRWLKRLGSVSPMSNDKNGTASGPRRPEDWTVKERAFALLWRQRS